MFIDRDNALLWVALAFLEDGTIAGTPDRGCASSSTDSSARARFLLALVVDLVAIAIVFIVVVCDWRAYVKVKYGGMLLFSQWWRRSL